MVSLSVVLKFEEGALYFCACTCEFCRDWFFAENTLWEVFVSYIMQHY